MKKRFAVLMSLIIISLFILSCAPQTPEAAEETPAEDIPAEVVEEPVPAEITAEPIVEIKEEPVAGTLSFSWEKDGGSRVADGSVPFVHGLKDRRVRLYYCNSKGILSAISKDGLVFTEEQGIRISPGTGFESIICDPTIVDLPDGKMRMYYKGADSQNPGPGQSIHKIYSAISSDGLAFKKEGLRIDSETNGDNGWASVPDAIILPDGRVRI